MSRDVGSETMKRPLMPAASALACLAPQTALLALVGAGLRPSSAAIHQRDVAEFLGWWSRDPAQASSDDIIKYLAERGAARPAAADRRLAALAHFFRAGIEAGRWSTDPTLGLPRPAAEGSNDRRQASSRFIVPLLAWLSGHRPPATELERGLHAPAGRRSRARRGLVRRAGRVEWAAAIRPPGGPTMSAIRIVVQSRLADGPGARDDGAMDPLVAALAQLVRDRYAAEQRARRRVRVLPKARS
ncbi:MAG: hypothetical protein EPN50_03895 [Chloroflexota bacterium]|nr:MAG: hypothetical protein EPN50_03895 [Chloroflexota bacterium]